MRKTNERESTVRIAYVRFLLQVLHSKSFEAGQEWVQDAGRCDETSARRNVGIGVGPMVPGQSTDLRLAQRECPQGSAPFGLAFGRRPAAPGGHPEFLAMLAGPKVGRHRCRMA